jgi:tetratricopeptide (TPR) repeat protein
MLTARQKALSGDWRSASSILRDLLAKPLPDKALAELWLAEALRQGGQHHEAAAAYLRAAADEAHRPMAKLGLSAVYLKLGRPWRAEKQALDAEEALRSGIFPAPMQAAIKLQLARCYATVMEFSDAIIELQEILEAAPAHHEANLELGQIFRTLGKPALAANHLSAALKAAPGDKAAAEALRRVCAADLRASRPEIPACRGTAEATP